MKALSLFSGIGGLDLAAEAAGVDVVAQVEIDPYCRRVLHKHWPSVPCYEDVRDVTADRLRADGIGPIDIIFGGPPCQGASLAGKRRGAADDRWLWPEYLRVLDEVQPRWALAENPRGILSVGTPAGAEFGNILRTLASLGYDASWCLYGADAVGAPHRRDRVFLIAHLAHATCRRGSHEQGSSDGAALGGALPGADGGVEHGAGAPRVRRCLIDDANRTAGVRGGAVVAHAGSDGQPQPGGSVPQQRGWTGDGNHETVAHAQRGRCERGPDTEGHQPHGHHAGRHQEDGLPEPGSAPDLADATGQHDRHGHDGAVAVLRTADEGDESRRHAVPDANHGQLESCVCGGADGLSRWLAGRGLTWHGWPAGPGEPQKDWESPRLATGVKDRVAKLRALGNAVVPQQATPIFLAIMAVEREVTA